MLPFRQQRGQCVAFPHESKQRLTDIAKQLELPLVPERIARVTVCLALLSDPLYWVADYVLAWLIFYEIAWIGPDGR
jgi:hypothetical protein